MKNKYSLILGIALIIAAGCKKEHDNEDAVVIQANGNIQDDIDQFRELLGPLNSGAASASGRREINWDGVPDELLGKPLPDDFFNPTGPGAPIARQRGLMYSPEKGEFVVSKLNFADINALAAEGFRPFSGTNTFANTTNSSWPVTFRVPGETTEASVKGFGAVFSDVDQSNSSFIELFDGTESLGRYFIPPHDQSNSFSFLGIYLKSNQKITRIEVGHPGVLSDGKADISNGGPKDLIVLDDFFYSEPQR